MKLSNVLITLAGGNVLVLLVITMVASLILGMGLPSVPCYIILAVIAAPTQRVHPKVDPGFGHKR